MNSVKFFPSEEMILKERLKNRMELCDDPRQIGEPTFTNPIPESRIGRYITGKRVCATADIDIIKAYSSTNRNLPSFPAAGPRERLFFDPAEVTVGIVTAGGIAPGLNTVIHSIVNMHSTVYGMRGKAVGFLGGFRGIERQHTVELEPSRTIEWIQKGGTGIYTGRDRPDVNAIVTGLVQSGIDILYIIGGDGSLSVAHLIAKEIELKQLKVVVAGIPKTMDNDVLWISHSFGFDTAVEEAASIVNAIHDEAKSTRRICLLPLFGREAGFVAAHAALACGHVDAILVPEVEFKLDPLLEYVDRLVKRKGHALVVMAEGACPSGYSEQDMEEELKRRGLDPSDRTNPRVSDALRSWRLNVIQDRFREYFGKTWGDEHQVFVEEPRYLIRAIPANSIDQIYCQRLADLAVHNALAGYTDFMISQWLDEYVLVPLKLVAEEKGPDGRRLTKKIHPGSVFWATVINSTDQPSFV
jgi:6-phosphofructokinase 1